VLYLTVGLLMAARLGAAEDGARAVFLKAAFPDGLPKSEVVWLTGKLRDTASDILGHKPGRLRIRYWRKAERTAWVLNEIGKDQPITAGIVIAANGVQMVSVLRYRERRGGEVRFPFFTRQFHGAKLDSGYRLKQHIDGISGATLSVRAMTRMTRLALYLHGVVTSDAP